MSDALPFKGMAKTPRWYRNVLVSEKLDGTNALVAIWSPSAVTPYKPDAAYDVRVAPSRQDGPAELYVRAGSRSQWIHPGADNHGFAAWVHENAGDLASLGIGQHFGEWWGKGINRGYGQDRKRFSLFNAFRWDFNMGKDSANTPVICDVVPVLYYGPMSPASKQDPVEQAIRRLQFSGSIAAPGWKDPEGVVIFHEALQRGAKYTFDGDQHKDL